MKGNLKENTQNSDHDKKILLFKGNLFQLTSSLVILFLIFTVTLLLQEVSFLLCNTSLALLEGHLLAVIPGKKKMHVQKLLDTATILTHVHSHRTK